MSELPAAKKSRVTKGFQPDWKKQWPWISGGPGAEDKPEDGVFCRLCMIHQKNNPILSRTGGKFVTAGFDTWNKAAQKLGGHDTSDLHKDSMQKERGAQVARQSGRSLQQMCMDGGLGKRDENRNYMRRVLDFLYFLIKHKQPNSLLAPLLELVAKYDNTSRTSLCCCKSSPSSPSVPCPSSAVFRL